MRTILLPVLLCMTILSCADKNKKFEDIDLLAYRYERIASESKEYAVERRLIPAVYIHIDKKYNCQIIYEVGLENSGTYYLETSIMEPGLKEIVDEIIVNSINNPSFLDLHPKGPMFYDGLEYKIRINKDNESKVIHFWESRDSSKVYENLYNLAEKLYAQNKAALRNDNFQLRNRRLEFIKFVEKSDSVMKLLPPLPPRDVIPKYTAPIVVDSF
jgi:hypothetical protein